MPDKKYQEEYINRIHKVQDYIEHHIGESMTIEDLSNAAGFSKYHFSRIFQSILHEPLAHYVNRIRMERALFALAHRTDKNITEIAYSLGFSDSAVFSRTFKNYYGVSPREFRIEYSKNCKDSFILSEYNKNTAKNEWVATPCPVKAKITIESLKEKNAVYVRHTGTYETLATEYVHLLQTLLSYAKSHHIPQNADTWVLAIYHDNPEFGLESQFRTSICMTVPNQMPIQEDGIVGSIRLHGGLYAVGHFQITPDQFGDAWNYMYQEWLTGSGYLPVNSYPFEVYLNTPEECYNSIQKVDIYVPIEPIRF